MDDNLRLDRLRNGPDLVNLEQETVARFFLNGSLDTKRVSDSEIVADDLDATLLGEVNPSLPIILVERVLDRDNGVLLNVADVQVGELFTSKPLRGVGVGILEVKIVFAVLIELGGSNVEGNLDFPLVAGILDGLDEELKNLLCARHVRGKSSFITNIDG